MDVLAQVWAERMKTLDSEGKRRDGESDAELFRFENMRAELSRFAFDTLGDDKRLWGATLDNFDAKSKEKREALRTVRRYLAEFDQVNETGRNLILFGGPGTGKDHLVMGLAKSVYAKTGIAFVRTDGPTMAAEVRSAIKKERENESLDRYMRCPVLWISDPCSSGSTLTPFQRDWFFRLVDHRYKNALPTIVTINADSGAVVGDMLGPASFDRLRGDCDQVFCMWESKRGVIVPAKIEMPFTGEAFETIVGLERGERDSNQRGYRKVGDPRRFKEVRWYRMPKSMRRAEWDKLSDGQKFDAGEYVGDRRE